MIACYCGRARTVYGTAVAARPGALASAFPGRVSTLYIILFEVHTYIHTSTMPTAVHTSNPNTDPEGQYDPANRSPLPSADAVRRACAALYRPCCRSSPLPAGRTTRHRHFNTMYGAIHTRHPVPYRPPDYPVLPALTCTWTWTSSRASPLTMLAKRRGN